MNLTDLFRQGLQAIPGHRLDLGGGDDVHANLPSAVERGQRREYSIKKRAGQCGALPHFLGGSGTLFRLSRRAMQARLLCKPGKLFTIVEVSFMRDALAGRVFRQSGCTVHRLALPRWPKAWPRQRHHGICHWTALWLDALLTQTSHRDRNSHLLAHPAR